ncbi:Protein lifeguard 2 [Goodea atripinnis]|uniref:Protein lifeguard 2 n=1 Tax=Goodea atripinnis TaxID=208336 RepID=A0ABV0N2W6_9TELE
MVQSQLASVKQLPLDAARTSLRGRGRGIRKWKLRCFETTSVRRQSSVHYQGRRSQILIDGLARKPIQAADGVKTGIMTQGKLSLANKASDSTSGEAFVAPAPPTYEEAVAGVSAPCYNDVEMLTEFSWDDTNIRRVFIRKVYSILMIQLLVTVAIVALFTFCDPVKDYIQTNPGWYWASYVVFFVTYVTLSCCSGPRRQFPWNLILLAIFTLSLSYMTGMLSSFYNTKSVVMCLGITAAVCLVVTVFSFQTKLDVTTCHGVLFIFCMVMFISGLVLAIVLPFQYVSIISQIRQSKHDFSL